MFFSLMFPTCLLVTYTLAKISRKKLRYFEDTDKHKKSGTHIVVPLDIEVLRKPTQITEQHEAHAVCKVRGITPQKQLHTRRHSLRQCSVCVLKFLRFQYSETKRQ